jgi:hypothetical protein
MKYRLTTKDRLGEGTLYSLDSETGQITKDRVFSPYVLKDLCEQEEANVPATLKNALDVSDFTPSVAIARGHCPDGSQHIIRSNITGQIESTGA